MTRAENKQLNIQEYEQGSTVLNSRPQLLVVELTQGCNLTCQMCRKTSISPVQSRLNRIHFEQFAEELFTTADIVDLRGWGESLILPDITDYINRTAAAGCRIRFVSNLSFHRPNVLECLAYHGALLTCSLDAADPDILGRLRKGARLSTILANLRFLTSASQNDKAITVLCTVQQPSLPSLPELPRILAEVGVRQLHLATVYSGSPELNLDNSCDYTRNQIRQTIDLCAALSIEVTLTTSLPGLPVAPMPQCMRPWTTMSINVDGRIGYCDHLIGPFGVSQLLGHVKEGALNVWNNDSWQRIRMRHVQKKPHFKKCVKCYREKGVDFEPMWLDKEWV